jgi:hypothetical protein
VKSKISKAAAIMGLTLLVIACVLTVLSIRILYGELTSTFRPLFWVSSTTIVEEVSIKTWPKGRRKNSTISTRYKYQYKGQTYFGHAIQLINYFPSHRSNSSYSDWFQRLDNAQKNAQPINVLINPSNPNEAVLSNAIRWGRLIFIIVFGIIVGSIGLGAGYGALNLMGFELSFKRKRNRAFTREQKKRAKRLKNNS